MRKTVLLSLLAASTLSFGIAQQTGGHTGGAGQTGGGQAGAAETNDSPESAPGVAAQSATGNALMYINARNPGGYVADPEGNSLYVLVDENGEAIPCDEECLQAYPPYTGEPVVDPDTGMDPSLVGTTDAANGEQQVTFGGFPLHYFSLDTQPGALEGQGQEAFGGHSYLIDNTGNVLESDPVDGTGN